MILFADDTNIFYSNDNPSKLVEVVNRELTKIKTWMDINKLSLNLGKTKVMRFGHSKKDELAININGVEIDNVSENKFLGIIIDDKLNWKQHIRHIKTKIAKNISVINKIKHVIEYKALHLLYCSLVLSYLSYGIEIWGNNYKSLVHPLFILQKRAIRIINKAGYYDHTNKLFLHSKQLKLPDLIEFYTSQLLYKASKSLLPMKIQELFELRVGEYELRGCLNFKIQTVRTTKKSMCVSVKGVRLWNGLESQLKKCSTLYKFKTMYKEKVLSKYRVEEEL